MFPCKWCLLLRGNWQDAATWWERKAENATQDQGHKEQGTEPVKNHLNLFLTQRVKKITMWSSGNTCHSLQRNWIFVFSYPTNNWITLVNPLPVLCKSLLNSQMSLKLPPRVAAPFASQYMPILSMLISLSPSSDQAPNRGSPNLSTTGMLAIWGTGWAVSCIVGCLAAHLWPRLITCQ